MALPRKVVLAIGIDDRFRRRQRTAELVMIEHHDIGAGSLRRVDRDSAVGAAVDGDDQRRATRNKFAKGFRIGSVPLEDAVRYIDLRWHGEMREKPLEQRR